jgi:hypothetical protein
MIFHNISTMKTAKVFDANQGSAVAAHETLMAGFCPAMRSQHTEK